MSTAVPGVHPADRLFAVDSVLAALAGDPDQAWRSGIAGTAVATRNQLGYWRDMIAVPLGWAEVHLGQCNAGVERIREALNSRRRHTSGYGARFTCGSSPMQSTTRPHQ